MKEYRVIWDDKAKSELKEIYEYLRRENVHRAALKVREELVKTARSLRTMPEKFKVYEYTDKVQGIIAQL